MRLIRGIGRLFTSGSAGVLRGASVLIDGERIAWAGVGEPDRELRRQITEDEDLGGALVTAGLVDAHTHPVYLRPRLEEIARRSAGATYSEIAAEGGGIRATVTSTRSAPADELRRATAGRLRAWAAAGTTTVEAKTGYHLERGGELAAVRLLAELSGQDGIPHLAVTFLGAHALPPEFSGRQDDYCSEVASWCAEAAAGGARFCDVFCDAGYFSVEQSRLVLEAGREAGLLPRVHADELAHSGGSLLAAELGAASADHLLLAGERDARALAAAGVSAVLCPGTALSLGKLPPARRLLEAGVTLALGSDHNPGTSGLVGVAPAIALAVAALGLSVEEALLAATAGGAASLRLGDRGVVEAGRRADLVAWDADHEGAFAWAFGLRARRVWLGGQA